MGMSNTSLIKPRLYVTIQNILVCQCTLRLPEVCIKCYKIEFIWPFMAVNDIHRLPYANSLVGDTISSIFLHRHKAKIYKLYKDDLQ